MVTLLYGLPLLTAYTNVDSSFYLFILIPYLAVSLTITVVILLLSRVHGEQPLSYALQPKRSKKSFFIARFNSVSSYFLMLVLTLAIISYSAMRLLIASAYPYPPSNLASVFGGLYIILLVISAILVFSRIVYSSFPILSHILAERRYAFMAILSATIFAIVYLLLVEQIVIIGFNEPGFVAPPTGSFPFLYIFTVGPQDPFVNFIYIPYVLIQVSPMVTIFIIPFEMIFATLLSLLTASNITMAHYLIRNSGLKCCTRATTMSTGGSILGLTATCPTCLVPSFVSVIFGGISAGEAAYSNVYGAVLPPMLSLAALLASLAYLSKSIKTRT